MAKKSDMKMDMKKMAMLAEEAGEGEKMPEKKAMKNKHKLAKP